MKPLEMLLQNAARSKKKIVLSEGSDPRALAAAIVAHKQGIARIVLIGPKDEIRTKYETVGGDPDEVEIHDPASSSLSGQLVDTFHELRKHKGLSLEDARLAVLNPHVYAALLVKTGRADGTVGGAVATTAEIVRTAIQVIGPRPGSKLVSSFFLMLFC